MNVAHYSTGGSVVVAVDVEDRDGGFLCFGSDGHERGTKYSLQVKVIPSTLEFGNVYLREKPSEWQVLFFFYYNKLVLVLILGQL